MRRRSLAASALLAAGAITVFIFHAKAGISEANQDWVAVIRTQGAATAYETMIRAFEDESPETRHNEAHRFGGALYDVEGLDGLAVCDTRFAYGCFHEFMGQAIQEHGLDVVRAFAQVCRSTPGVETEACMHGIGHGIVAYMGYGRNDLDRAVGECADLDARRERRACYGGVFMEYNLRIMADDGIRNMTDDFFEPCGSFDGLARRTCTFFLPQWWFQNLAGDQEERFGRMGDMCTASADRNYCAGGIGYIVMAESDADITRAGELCAIAARSPRDEAACRAVAAQSFSFNFDAATGERMCDGLTDESRVFCVAYARAPSGMRPALSELP